MKIVTSLPPNIEEIRKVFNNRGYDAIYAYGDTIYNPAGYPMEPALVAHEEEHGKRQRASGLTIEEWWKVYLANAKFRYIEELYAHRAELAVRLVGTDRNSKEQALMLVARRLISPFYALGEDRPSLKKAIEDLKSDALY